MVVFSPSSPAEKAIKGGRSGRGLVAQRFNAAVVEDWGNLVTLWQKDMEKLGNRQIARAVDRSEEDEVQFLKRTAVDLIGKGQVS